MRRRGASLRVLLVEDSENDALLLMQRELERGGYELLYERVETPEAMEKALGTATSREP